MSVNKATSVRPKKRRQSQTQVTIFAFIYGAFAAGAVYFGALFVTNLSLIAASAGEISESIIRLPGQIVSVADPTRRDARLEERVNILLMGNDMRAGEDRRLVRTDTMIIASIDPVNGAASMLSIPRDLWVPIPVGTGASREVVQGRINEAYRTGYLRDYPGGGAALAKRTVEYNFGIPIHYYAMINFDGFEKMVDVLEGIEVDIPYRIVDTRYPTEDYGYQTVIFEPGHQTLGGAMALKYARTRNVDGDFARIRRQQQVIMAVRDRALQLNMLPRLPQLAGEFADAVDTDMPVADGLVLANLARDIPREEISSATLEDPAVSDAMTPGGALVLQPNRDQIALVVQELFYDPHLRKEGARVQVANASEIQGAAQRTADMLERRGWREVTIATAPEAVDSTIIYAYADMERSVQALAEILQVSEDRIEQRTPTDPEQAFDIEVVLGRDARTVQALWR